VSAAAASWMAAIHNLRFCADANESLQVHQKRGRLWVAFYYLILGWLRISLTA
jgi:hypothetical protein